MQKYYSTNNIVLIRKKGAVEDFIQSIFNQTAKSTPAIPLKIKTVELSDTFYTKDLLLVLDSTKNNVIICGSVNEVFSLRLVRAVSASPSYNSVVVGMPNWDGLKDFDKPDCKGVDIIYSSPYNFSKADKFSQAFIANYNTKYAGRPTDMAFKGFESMYRFSKLLVAHGNNTGNFLSEKKYKVFNDFDIRAVINKSNYSTDYFENKKLYFVKKSDGNIKSIY